MQPQAFILQWQQWHALCMAVVVCLKDFDSWFDTNNCLENAQLVERLHAVSNFALYYSDLFLDL